MGNIYICGEIPGTPESGVPGKRVGYMPQVRRYFAGGLLIALRSLACI